MLSLRDYQADGVGGIRVAYQKGFKAPLYVLPTGGGKTVVFSYIAQNTSLRQKKVLILVHRVELMKQTSAALMSAGVIHGLINPKYRPNLMAGVQVASVQTLVNRLHKTPFTPDLIIIDEAHHATAGTWRKICLHYPEALLLGVTATPIRSDGAGLGIVSGGFFDTLIIGPQIQDLINKKFLVKPIVYAPLERLDLSDVKIDQKRNDYNRVELTAAIDKPRVTGNALAEYKRLCPGWPAVVFCISVSHAEHVAAEFRAAGFAFYAVDGAMDDDLRERRLTGLGNGSVQGVCSCDLISEGTDIPAVGCVILLRPTKSTGLFIQQVGRGLRPAPGKDRCYILDHAGNVLRHGMPDDARAWSLEGEKKQKKLNIGGGGPALRQCPQCFAMHYPALNCPICGYSYAFNPSDLPTEAGQLEEVTAEAAIRIKRQRIKEVAQARSIEELEWIAEQRGYKKSWAKHIYESRNKK